MGCENSTGKNGCTNKLKQSASDINADLLKQYTEIQNIFKEFEVQNVMPTTEQVKDAFVLSTKVKDGAEQDKVKEPSDRKKKLCPSNGRSPLWN